jgi:hypothetical protein
MLPLQREEHRGMVLVETEAERRYEMDQIVASARLEGLETSSAMLALMDRYVRGEIARSDFGRLADEMSANTDYEALARAQAAQAMPRAPSSEDAEAGG